MLSVQGSYGSSSSSNSSCNSSNDDNDINKYNGNSLIYINWWWMLSVQGSSTPVVS